MKIAKSSLIGRRVLMVVGAASVLIGAMPKSAVAYLNGIDVYELDNGKNNVQPVNWTTVKNGGYTFAFVKADEGTEDTDTAFAVNMSGANAAGIYVGPYHFAHTESLSPAGTEKFDNYTGGALTYNSSIQVNRDAWTDATLEAVDFIKLIRPYYYQTGTTHYLLPVSDIEQADMPNLSPSLKMTFVSNWAEVFAETVYDALGVRPMLYLSESSANENFTSAVAQQQPFWIAWYKTTGTSQPPLQSDTHNFPLWSFWQWTDTGNVAGVHGSGASGTDVDQDLFNGTTTQLAAMSVQLVQGDYNHNKTVDASDYVVWRKEMSLPTAQYNAYSVVNLGADGDSTGTSANKVDAKDYTFWRAHFGATLSGSGSGSGLDSSGVPEPCSLLLVLSGIFCLLSARQRR